MAQPAKVLLLVVTEAAVRSHNVAKEAVLTSERKGHILPVVLEPTSIPPGLEYPLAGIQQIEYFQGDPGESLNGILRSLQKPGVAIAVPQGAVAPGEAARAGQSAAAPVAHGGEHVIERGALAVDAAQGAGP